MRVHTIITSALGAPGRGLVRLLATVPRHQIFALAVLMVLNALTNGFGILMLVPLLNTTTGIQEGHSIFSTALGAIGLHNQLALILVIFVVLVAIRGLVNFYQEDMKTRVESDLVDSYRIRCFSGLIEAEWRWLSQSKIADHTALISTDVNRIGFGFSQAMRLITDGFTALAYLSAALALSWQVAVAALVGGVLVSLAFSRGRRRASELGTNVSLVGKDMQRQLQEGLSSVRLAKAFGRETRQIEAMRESTANVRQQMLAYRRLTSFSHGALTFGGAALLALMLYLGLTYWLQPFQVLLPLLLVFVRLIPILGSLQQSWQDWLYAFPAYERAEQLLANSKIHAEPAPTTDGVILLTDAVRLHNVHFTYPGRKIAAQDGVTLALKAQTTTAIFGTSGSGKSTMADILIGLIEPDAGAMMVDDVVITGGARRMWRKSVAYVQQEAFLFHDSIRANLLWSKPDATDAELSQALTMASAEFVHKLPDGLETIVGDGGVRLSGGERQRIALARALLHAPALLILDEATSALDTENETAIRRALAGLHGKLTVVIIGHRLAMLDQADQIIELEAGRVKQCVTHPIVQCSEAVGA